MALLYALCSVTIYEIRALYVIIFCYVIYLPQIIHYAKLEYNHKKSETIKNVLIAKAVIGAPYLAIYATFTFFLPVKFEEIPLIH